MPHALFLGSSLATLDRVTGRPLYPKDLPGYEKPPSQKKKSPVMRYLRSLLSVVRVDPLDDEETVEVSLRFVLAHLRHGIVDMGMWWLQLKPIRLIEI